MANVVQQQVNRMSNNSDSLGTSGNSGSGPLKRPRTSSQTISKQSSGKTNSSSNNTPIRQFIKQVKREGEIQNSNNQKSSNNSTDPSVSNGKANNTSSGNSGHERSGSRSSSENNINTERFFETTTDF